RHRGAGLADAAHKPAAALAFRGGVRRGGAGNIAASRRAGRILSFSVVLSRQAPQGGSMMSNVDRLPFVEAELNYLGRTGERPRYSAYEPTDADLAPVMPLEPHLMQIHDLRPVQHDLSLDTQGFQLREQASAVADFWDDDEVRRVYYPEAERFIRELT